MSEPKKMTAEELDRIRNTAIYGMREGVPARDDLHNLLDHIRILEQEREESIKLHELGCMEAYRAGLKDAAEIARTLPDRYETLTQIAVEEVVKRAIALAIEAKMKVT